MTTCAIRCDLFNEVQSNKANLFIDLLSIPRIRVANPGHTKLRNTSKLCVFSTV